ncbi:hypothetical protein AiwAL_00210 [Acidiphilium sp. AL]|uniref:hypothetical protein n=1 Tax=Acidiphilium sp. AL TaxID=2871704 RepID=UPI0021CB9314|nr:hypothetical protein [Acidiphilium sp. AL]MCU4158530.1 hypothetical protein [Acidiphilium sp. AL]
MRILAELTLAAALAGSAAAASPPVGLWQGSYDCAQGETALALQITAQGPSRISAIFYFHALAANPHVPQGCFMMRGRYDAATRRITLNPARWLARPPFYVRVALSGMVGRDGSTIAGHIAGPACSAFAVTRSVAPPIPPAPAPCWMDRNGPTV